MKSDIWEIFAETLGADALVPIALPADQTYITVTRNADGSPIWSGAPFETSLPTANLGKVPSLHLDGDRIVGASGWQEGKSTFSKLLNWKNHGGYGFGVLTGRPLPNKPDVITIAVDADCDDPAKQDAIQLVLMKRLALGLGDLAMRTRDNSARRAYLLYVKMPEAGQTLTKRVLTMATDDFNPEEKKAPKIEFLAIGQQLACYGRHPSGADIEWLNAPAISMTADRLYPQPEILTISYDNFQLLIQELSATLKAVSDTGGELILAANHHRAATKSTGTRHQLERSDNPFEAPDNSNDPVAHYLDAHGWVLGYDQRGARILVSPFAHEYEMGQPSGDTSVVYYAAGTGINPTTGKPYEQGHFKSFHSSDAHRTDADWLEAIGYAADQFDVIRPPEVEAEQTAEAAAVQAGMNDEYNIFPLMKDAGGFSLPTPGDYCVRELIPAQGTGLLVGKSSSGKTFAALSLAAAIATGRGHWSGRFATRGSVVFIAGEPGSGLRQRLRVLAKAYNNGEPMKQLFVIEKPINLSETGNSDTDVFKLAKLINAINRDNPHAPVRLIVADTVSQTMSGDQNSRQDVSAYLGNYTKLARHYRCAVMGIHHLGKDASKGATGSAAWRDNVDFLIQMERVGSRAILTYDKLRDGESEPEAFLMRREKFEQEYIDAAEKVFKEEAAGRELMPRYADGKRQDGYYTLLFHDKPCSEETPRTNLLDNPEPTKDSTLVQCLTYLLKKAGGEVASHKLKDDWLHLRDQLGYANNRVFPFSSAVNNAIRQRIICCKGEMLFFPDMEGSSAFSKVMEEAEAIEREKTAAVTVNPATGEASFKA